MRTLLFLLLFVSGFAYAQPPINNPTPYEVCDDNNDGVAFFDLHTKDSEITGGNASLVVSYYVSQVDAQNDTNSITQNLFSSFLNQNVWVRVVDPADSSNPNYTTLSLVVNPLPIANQAPNMVVVDNPFDGTATFDLTSQTGYIGVGPATIITFYSNLADAQANTNPITNPSAYVNLSNPQTIGVRVTNAATGCFSINSFQLIVQYTNIVYIPDPVLKARLLNHYPSINTNNDNEIQVSEALATTFLNLTLSGCVTDFTGLESFTNATAININNDCNIGNFPIMPSVLTFGSSSNSATNTNSIDVTSFINLQTLNVSNNVNLTSINISGLTHLQSINASESKLTSIDLTGLINLQNLNLYRNNTLSSLDLNGLVNLQTLNCYITNISTLNLDGLSNLQNVICGGALTNFSATGTTNLNHLEVKFNSFTSLTLSESPNLNYLDCSNNSNMNSLFIKNGSNEQYLNFQNDNNLSFVCADESEITSVQTFLSQNNINNCQVNTYCSFIPGGNYNTITGAVTLDANNNGCDSNDLLLSKVRINISNGLSSGATCTDANGVYNFYPLIGNFTVTPEIENSTWFTFSPTNAIIPFTNANNNSITQNFCIVPNGVHNDLEVVVEPTSVARPGFNATYKLVLKNKGNQTLSNSTGLKLNYDTTKMSFVTSSIVTSNSGTGFLDFGYNIAPFETKVITITFNINSPIASSPTNINDVLNFVGTITTTVTDENPDDNSSTFNQVVVGAYDPNAVTCIEGATVSPSQIGNYLHYAINFENTGNYQAENVVVKDVIDVTKYDINSLQVLNTSNPAYIKVSGNVVEFIFENINLAAIHGNPPVGGHGDVLFKIKSLNNLVAGDIVSKTAKIYFDYNAPINTNNAETTFVALNNSIHQLDLSISIYPNPTSSTINIKCDSTIESIELYDIMGRILETSIEKSTEIKFDISDKQVGTYFLKITTEKGSKVEKIVKE